jgi:hypothetical protein
MKHLLRLSILTSVLFFTVSVAWGVDIDDFSNMYPPNPDLPSSGREIIFVGSTCDGSACPPGSIIRHPVDNSAYQTGLSGAVGGERYAHISYVAGTANSNIYGPGNVLTFNHNAGASAVLTLEYGMAVDLNADFSAIGATKFMVTVVSGDMYSGPRPVPCTITVISGRGTTVEAIASSTLDLVDEATYNYPFSGFGPVDFSDIDYIKYTFDASAVTSVDFAIGPLSTNGGDVDAGQSTWGAIKELYR